MMPNLVPIGSQGHRWEGEQSIRLRAAQEGLSNVFNPSLTFSGGREYLAFRGLPRGGSKPFDAFVATRASQDDEWHVDSLTKHARNFGVDLVADPKLFTFANDVYATFNTGYSTVQNEVYVMRVFPELGPPQRCVLVGARQKVEKNWAFYGTRGSVLEGIYRLSPFTELQHLDGILGQSASLAFERRTFESGRSARNLAIGTPVVTSGDTRTLVAHQKLQIGRKRMYLGRIVQVTQTDRDIREIKVSRNRMIHDKRMLLPARSPHNPNLFSATYFSGLCRAGGTLVVSYGINDSDFAIRSIDPAAVW